MADDLSDLLLPHSEVWNGACGGWQARWSDGVLRLEGDGRRIDGLRAACDAAWAEADDGHAPTGAFKPVLDRLG